MASDQTVTAQDLLDALSEVRRQGSGRLLEQLEEVEPALAGHLMEELSLVHQALLDLRAKPKATRRLVRQVESMAVVLVTALRQAHLRLWQEESAGGRLAQIDPALSKDAQPPAADSPTQDCRGPDGSGGGGDADNCGGSDDCGGGDG